jgi:hypothetical protein
MAIWRRASLLDGLICHSDAGSQYTAIRYTERLAEIGAAPSVGSVGDSYDNSLAESTIGLYKTELICRHGPGARLRRSNWPPSPRSTGSTTADSTAKSATSHPLSSRPPTTINWDSRRGLNPTARVSTKTRAVHRAWSRSNTPALAHSSSRRQQVVAEPQPNLLGRQQAPGGTGASHEAQHGHAVAVRDAARGRRRGGEAVGLRAAAGHAATTRQGEVGPRGWPYPEHPQAGSTNANRPTGPP